MSPGVTWAVALRVLRQLRRDRRTAAMLLVLPCLVLMLLRWMFGSTEASVGFDELGPPMLALVPFVVMFLVTSVTTLRERTSGTLERLLAMPTGRGDLIGGYAVAFALVAAVQSVAAVGVCLLVLDLDVAGPGWLLVLVAVVDAVLGSALGLLVSAFARTEFQAVQFLPVVVLPQLLLCGLFLPRDLLPQTLELVSAALPLSYAVDAVTSVSSGGSGAADPRVWTDLALVLAFTAAGLAVGAATLRRRTP